MIETAANLETPQGRHDLAVAIYRSLFREQRQAVADPCRRKVLWTTARAGKTWTPLSDFVAQGILHPNSAFVYIALTHNNAELIAWPVLKHLDRAFGLGARFQEQKLRMILPTGSLIQLFGADRPGWIMRLYGTKLRGAHVDEAAFFSIDLRDVVDDVLRGRLSDLAGTLYLSSIPGFLPRGVFYELTKGFDHAEVFAGRTPPPTPYYPSSSQWSVHTWTTEQNPHMREVHRREIAEWREADPECEKDPRFLRNYLKAWVAERGERVYDWSAEKNTYLGEWQHRPDNHYVLGIDFGWADATATSLNYWREDRPVLVEVESWKVHPDKEEFHLEHLAAHIRDYLERYPVGPDGAWYIVADPAHRQLFEEFRRVYEIPVMEAEKANKHDAIRLLNSQYRQGLVQIVRPESSPHVEEAQSLSWTTRLDGTRKETQGQPNDCCDAHLMAWRHAAHYLRGEAEPTVQTAAEVYADERRRMIMDEVERLEEEQANAWNDF